MEIGLFCYQSDSYRIKGTFKSYYGQPFSVPRIREQVNTAEFNKLCMLKALEPGNEFARA